MFVWNTLRIVVDPMEFFLDSQEDDTWRTPYLFALQAIALLSLLTPFINYFGVSSNPLTSALAAQMSGYVLLQRYFLPRFGLAGYVLEGLIIALMAHLLLLAGTFVFHYIFRFLGGRGPMLNMWRAMCYGLAPTLVGFLPFLGILGGVYATLLQLYLAPRILYRVKEGRAIWPAVLVLAYAFTRYINGPQ